MDAMCAVDPRPNRIIDPTLLSRVDLMIQKKILDGKMTKDEAWEEFRRDLKRRMDKKKEADRDHQ